MAVYPSDFVLLGAVANLSKAELVDINEMDTLKGRFTIFYLNMATSTEALLMSMGTVRMWGFSPSFDLLQMKCMGPEHDVMTSDCINILLAGPGDIRHILHSIANRRRNAPNASIRIYIFEKALETLAREMLLLHIFLSTNIPIRQRCSIFLEVFGNALIQSRTEHLIEELAQDLVNLAYNEPTTLSGLIDLSHLKMRTVDELIEIMKSWNHKAPFDVKLLRDHRLRHYYQLRYDHRNNIIDWDYTMDLKTIKKANVIHIKQYREWRNSGIAFEFGDQVYSMPNRTMASYTEVRKHNHGSVLCRGLWTDIVIGPYISFGVELCDRSNEYAEQLFEVQNAGTGVVQNRHNTTEVAIFNLLTLMYAIEKGESYQMTKAHDIYSGIRELEGKYLPICNDTSESLDAKTIEEDASGSSISLQENEALRDVKIIPITGPLENIFRRKHYSSLFSHVFISTDQSFMTQPDSDYDITNIMRDKATVSLENSTFLLPLKKDQRALYTKKVVKNCKKLGLELDTDTRDADAVLHFHYCRNIEKAA